MRGRKHSLVLDGRHHGTHAGPTVSRGQSGTHNAQVISFRSAGREDHLIRLGTEGVCDLTPSLLDPRTGRSAEAVRARRVPERLISQVGKHRLQHLRPNWSRGGVIEVNRPCACREDSGGKTRFA